MQTFLVVTTRNAGRHRCTTGIWWVEIRDAAKHPTMHRTAPHNKELSSKKCQQCEVEKPWLKQKTL